MIIYLAGFIIIYRLLGKLFKKKSVINPVN
jgi:hypothetical protein